jgi:UTP--glucose-1-phosphate uridylyltransferase
MATLNQIEAIYAYNFEGKRYDVGEKMGFIQTTIELALQREDLRYELLDFFNKVIEKEVTEI